MRKLRENGGKSEQIWWWTPLEEDPLQHVLPKDIAYDAGFKFGERNGTYGPQPSSRPKTVSGSDQPKAEAEAETKHRMVPVWSKYNYSQVAGTQDKRHPVQHGLWVWGYMRCADLKKKVVRAKMHLGRIGISDDANFGGEGFLPTTITMNFPGFSKGAEATAEELPVCDDYRASGDNTLVSQRSTSPPKAKFRLGTSKEQHHVFWEVLQVQTGDSVNIFCKHPDAVGEIGSLEVGGSRFLPPEIKRFLPPGEGGTWSRLSPAPPEEKPDERWWLTRKIAELKWSDEPNPVVGEGNLASDNDYQFTEEKQVVSSAKWVAVARSDARSLSYSTSSGQPSSTSTSASKLVLYRSSFFLNKVAFQDLLKCSIDFESAFRFHGTDTVPIQQEYRRKHVGDHIKRWASSSGTIRIHVLDPRIPSLVDDLDQMKILSEVENGPKANTDQQRSLQQEWQRQKRFCRILLQGMQQSRWWQIAKIHKPDVEGVPGALSFAGMMELRGLSTGVLATSDIENLKRAFRGAQPNFFNAFLEVSYAALPKKQISQWFLHSPDQQRDPWLLPPLDPAAKPKLEKGEALEKLWLAQTNLDLYFRQPLAWQEMRTPTTGLEHGLVFMQFGTSADKIRNIVFLSS